MKEVKWDLKRLLRTFECLTLNKADLHLSLVLYLLSLKAYTAEHQRNYCEFS